MANTEGLSDEALASLFSMPNPEQEEQIHSRRLQNNAAAGPRFPRRALGRREQMMVLGEGERPSATVVRSSKPPSIRSVSSKKNENSVAAGDGKKKVSFDHVGGGFQPTLHTNNPLSEEAEDSPKAAHENESQSKVRPVFLSESIRERSVGYEGSDGPTANSTGSKRESRFKQRNRIKDGQPRFSPTVGGFPSLNVAPVGTLTRKGRSCRDSQPQSTTVKKDEPTHSTLSMTSCSLDKSSEDQSELYKNANTFGSAGQMKLTDDVGSATDSMIKNMSPEQIRDALSEISSVLSADSIAFLNKRGREKMSKSQAKGKMQNFPSSGTCMTKVPVIDDVTSSKEDEIKQEEQREREAKEQTAKILSSVRTHEDMDRAYIEAVELGLATELPSSTLEEGEAILLEQENPSADSTSRHKYLHVATSLIRSTVSRQRLLGAKRICSILEEDTNQMITARIDKSFSWENDDRLSLKQSYPPLLPVAIRCLLDEAIPRSHTSSGRLLLGMVLRSINALMILFVHPYHVLYFGKSSSSFTTDATTLYQTCFMSDIFHVPLGSDLYPPTKIEPIEDGMASNASFYRTNSSAVSAESDSKSFYSDPAWTMISRMKMIPCMSNVVSCLSKGFGEIDISTTNLNSICGILAMMAIRSPGAALAIASHKQILPVLIAFCISPSRFDFDDCNAMDSCVDHKSSGERGNGISNVRSEFCKTATPALQLLCIVARQSRDVAQLELFETIIPDLQAILCMGPHSEESDPQKWSLILLRTLLQYGLALQHTQSIISLATPYISVMSDLPHKLCAEYLTLFARICDCARAHSAPRKEEDVSRASPDSDVLGNLAMSGVWLTSSVKACVNSLISIRESPLSAPIHSMIRFRKMQLSAAQLRLLSAFTAASSPTSLFDEDELHNKMKTNFIPVVSVESCFNVFDSILKSNIWIDAMDIALRHSFNAGWYVFGDTPSFEEESIACSFVTEFMNFVRGIKEKGIGNDHLHEIVIVVVKDTLAKFRFAQDLPPLNPDRINASRQSWFVEAEFAVLKYLIEMRHSQLLDSILLMDFAFSLIGRLNVGHEMMAFFIFNQDDLFSVPYVSIDAESKTSHIKCLQMALLNELSNVNSRRAQLEHSACLYYSSNDLQPKPFKLRSLRCSADVIIRSHDERSLFPMGELWLWHLVSSTVEMPKDSSTVAAISDETNVVTNASDIVTHVLKLLFHLEAASLESRRPSRVDIGTKLYHISNVFLYPEEVLSVLERTVAELFRMIYYSESPNNSSTLVRDFIKACYNHSRISKDKKPASHPLSDEVSDDSNLNSVFSQGQLPSDGLSQDEIKALDDFVSDICESYLEHGGQYDSFSMFLRLLLRHDFPPKIISDVLTKLHPILNLLTIKEDRESLHSSLTRSVSGGLPSRDGSRRDPSSVLDAFAIALKKRDRELSRQDYVYLLSIAVLSRNLASNFQRCECGLGSMKKRLSGIRSTVLYDVFHVSKLILESAAGTKESLIRATLDTCLNSSTSLFLQDMDEQIKWTWDKSSEDTVWIDAVLFLGKKDCK